MLKLNDKTLNVIYSLGAAVVILGALFKITHWPLPFGITGNVVLGIGLVSEAFVFILYAFNPPGSDYAWERVYPELLDEDADPKPARIKQQIAEVNQLDVSLSDKLDKLLAEAQIDVSLFDRLKTGIDRFSTTVEQINGVVDVSGATQKYNDQLTLAASHLENMNALYALQIEHNKNQTELSQTYVNSLMKSTAQSEEFNQELDGLTSNLNNLNKVYGGMLNAMKG